MTTWILYKYCYIGTISYVIYYICYLDDKNCHKNIIYDIINIIITYDVWYFWSYDRVDSYRSF